MDTTSNYRKHTTSNAVQTYLIGRFYRELVSMIRDKHIGSVLDVGCGEGFTLARLKREKIGSKHVGIDPSVDALKLAKKIHPDIPVKPGDIYSMEFKTGSQDLVICTEVLEHLERPSDALKELLRVCGRYLVLSVPNEPYFQIANFMRGKYLKSWGNHPEHIQHWTTETFAEFLKNHGIEITTLRTPFPWILVLGKK